MAIVSIKSQQVTFYDADGWIVSAPVSTGTKGRETPAGVFAVLEKDLDHHSTLYDDASMPHMQRLTWNGIALHGGPLPGYAASHGCVRMPYDFAKKLFDKTRIGMRVIVSPNDAAPAEFSHSALPVPNAEAIAAAPARAETLARETVETAKAADEAKKSAKTAEREAASAKTALRKAERQKSSADADLASAEKALDKAKSGVAKAEEQKLKAAAKVADAGTNLDTVQGRCGCECEDRCRSQASRGHQSRTAEILCRRRSRCRRKGNSPPHSRTRPRRRNEGSRPLPRPQKRVRNSTLPRPMRMRRTTRQPKPPKPPKQPQPRKPTPPKPRTTQSSHSSRCRSTSAARHRNSTCGGTRTSITPTAARSSIRPSRPRSRSATRTGPSARTYSRRWRSNDAGLRWSVVTIDGGDDAKDALDRITIPQDVLDRIAPTALPRSSIVVSDEPLSRETNFRTEFVAVLSNQPQGGFITRKPTISVPASQLQVVGRRRRSSAFLAHPAQARHLPLPGGAAGPIRCKRAGGSKRHADADIVTRLRAPYI